MCEHHGNYMAGVEELLSQDRRHFLKRTALAGAVLALPVGIAALLDPTVASAADMTHVKATHGTGFCNLGIFLAKKRGLAKVGGVDIDFVVTPSNADIATMFGAGFVDISLIPYTNFMTLYDAGAPVRIVAGGGVGGCVIVGKEGIKTAADMKGMTLGTFQADTLEMLPYDWLKKAGLSFKDVKVRYFNTSPELAQAFISGNLDAMCHIEPYATQAVNSRKGSTVLSDGSDVYGKNYSDCVLAARIPLIEKKPEVLKAVIKALMLGQYQAQTDPESALKDTVGTYYKTTMDAARVALARQPLMVDQRNQTEFIISRGQDLEDLGYIKKLPDARMFDWTLLEQVISENKSLYDSLKLKSA